MAAELIFLYLQYFGIIHSPSFILYGIRKFFTVGIGFAGAHLHEAFVFNDVGGQMAAINAAGVDADGSGAL